MRKLVLLLSIWLITGCAKSIGSFQVQVEEASVAESGSQSTQTPTDPVQDPVTPPPPSTPGNSQGLCGPLNFDGIQWTNALNTTEQKGLSLSLSVSGSFEGRSGWANITNNFDGMGLSLGLLQQNFGSGSLQPLLLKFRSRDLASFKSFFKAADFSSLEAMLLDWNSSQLSSVSSKIEASDELFPDQQALSDLDVAGPFEIQEKSVSTLATAESKSVTWAKANLYSDGGTTFIPQWKTSLSQMAASVGYRSIQVESALSLFAKAKGYFEAFGFTEMRSLLLMYDFVVQNGGFNPTHKSEYQAYLATHPGASETEKALNLLEIRLKSTVPEWTADVRARKTAIINTKGLVHGASRDFAREYCFDPFEKISSVILP